MQEKTDGSTELKARDGVHRVQEQIKLVFKGNDLYSPNIDAIEGSGILEKLTDAIVIKNKGVRFRPMDYQHIRDHLASKGFIVNESFNTNFELDFVLSLNFKPRWYQEAAFKAWIDSGCRGIVVLPTGAGKTYLGMMAVCHLGIRTLVVVPTLELMDQWNSAFKKAVSILGDPGRGGGSPTDKRALEGIELIGRFGGGIKNIAPITISTYSSAYLYLNRLRDKFGLVIFDEVHHLPAEKFQFIASGSIAPNRLGLTATLDDQNEMLEILDQVVGPVAYSLSPRELSDTNSLAPFVHERVMVDLDPATLSRYNELKEIYRNYIAKLPGGRNKFRHLIYNANRDPDARKALMAFNKARKIAFNSDEKITAIYQILLKHPKDRIIIFSEDISFVERVSREFLVPALTSNTPSVERREILNRFRTGKYRIISAGKVLDEGVDVPEASVGIIVSGTGVPRQFIQRLGRLLRPLPGKSATLYEIVTNETAEKRLSKRRAKKVKVKTTR
ncbi:MAG: DEAD/DEAH box helicase [Promethearchaeota archaeon]